MNSTFFLRKRVRDLVQTLLHSIYNAYMNAREYMVPQATQDAELG